MIRSYSSLLLFAATSLLLSACGPKASDAMQSSGKDAQLDKLTVGFYNLENLFDTDDDKSNKGDDEWLPTSDKRWNAKRYQEKLGRMSGVIAELGSEVLAGGPVLLGVCEIENEKVLKDLIAQPKLSKSNYGVIHFDSPDYRGIDNGLLYRKDYFTPLTSQNICLPLGLRDDGTKRTTRDVIVVQGLLLGDTVTYIVNHWPSRSGGEARSRPGRAAAALLNRKIVDSLRSHNRMADIIIVGDMNDDPKSPSLTKSLKAVGRRADAGQTGLYNPMMSLFNQGEGSLGYRDSWNLFDQIIVSEGMAKASDDWMLRNVRVYRKSYLLQPSGRYKGYPLRTYVGDNYKEGYSDHLPVYGVVTRPKK
ncbi:MAG: endonuclease/exonuclease/phosphatase family protein [Saprospiraceae bacterium]